VSREVAVRLEWLSDAAFAPFGQIVGAGERPASFEAAHLWNWRIGFEADGPTEVLLIRYKYQEPAFRHLERHFHVTQGFVPLGGVASIMVVAAPTDPDDMDAIPAAESVRAFLMDGGAGVVLHRGTWHALSRFPVRPPHVDVAFLTDRATQADIEASGKAGTSPVRTQIVDYAARFGVSFRVTDPAGLLR
jgi:ureidoglycolate hydrolase